MDYIGTIAPFAMAYMLSYSFETLLKTDGYPKLATICVVSGAVLNCVLDYVFVFIFEWGVKGAAFATGISQATVVVLYLIHFLGKNATIRFRRFPFRATIVARQIRNGLSSGITEFSGGIIIFFFNQAILAYIGEDALVSYTIISYVNTLIVMSLTGIAQGTQPLISYYLGKKEESKCRKLLRYSVVAGAGFSIVSTVLCYLLAGGIVALFLEDGNLELSAYSVRVLRIFILSFLPAAYNVVIGGYFASIEKAVFATLISITRSMAALVGALVLLTALFGGEGIWWAPLAAEMLCLIMTAVMFFCDWKKSKKKS